MPSNFNKFKYALLGTILLAVTVITAYQLLYAIPEKKCDAAHAWWSFRYRQCYVPTPIVDLTGRHKTAAGGATGAASSASPAAAMAPAVSGASAAAAGHP